jgi:hypothetical protein
MGKSERLNLIDSQHITKEVCITEVITSCSCKWNLTTASLTEAIMSFTGLFSLISSSNWFCKSFLFPWLAWNIAVGFRYWIYNWQWFEKKKKERKINSPELFESEELPWDHFLQKQVWNSLPFVCLVGKIPVSWRKYNVFSVNKLY